MNMTSQVKCREEPHHIMVVDDESHVGLYIEVLLASRGFDVTRCVDSKDALSRFAAQPWLFDLVVTDQNMPKMCGSELAKKLLAIRTNMPIILCTGSGYKDIEQITKDIGISAYLPKPLKASELLAQINQSLKANRHQHNSLIGN